MPNVYKHILQQMCGCQNINTRATLNTNSTRGIITLLNTQTDFAGYLVKFKSISGRFEG